MYKIIDFMLVIYLLKLVFIKIKDIFKKYDLLYKIKNKLKLKTLLIKNKGSETLFINYSDKDKVEEEYFKSEKWKIIRQNALKKSKYKCEICGNIANLEVYHKNYHNVGNEKDDDLIVLCNKCCHSYLRKE